ncbi:MAG TPA: WhiB family transcriptional regulator [Jatrophihabitans sp.]|nr:WhiB family transcriptional regulator [Jatrophihabitans sp.]
MNYSDKRPAASVLATGSVRRTGHLTGRPGDREAIDGIGKRAPLDLPCHRHDPNLWFAEAPHELEFAKALCRPCPVRQACLAGALRRKEPSGVWGGEIVIAGRVVPRKRPRGRPRKDASTTLPGVSYGRVSAEPLPPL